MHSVSSDFPINTQAISSIQSELDQIASRYQYDESIGSDRHKLYEIQGLIHYYNNNDEMALHFMDQAVEMNGADIQTAKNVRKSISESPSKSTESSTDNDSSRLKAVAGIVIFIVLGLAISFGINATVDANADGQINEVLDICAQDPDSSSCAEIKDKYNATVTCDDVECKASVPVTHWYLFPIKNSK